MRILLTGITGNLGHELASDLVKRGHSVVSLIHPRRYQDKSVSKLACSEILYADLLDDNEPKLDIKVDGILHSAGVVNFMQSQQANTKMMKNIIKLAKKLEVPIYHISTAFVYRPHEGNAKFNNMYEEDKWHAEQLLLKSGVPFSIFRPSVLMGNSKTGKIQNFSGYYLVLAAFIKAVKLSKQEGQILRFPRLLGVSDIITVDQAAKSINALIDENKRGEYFVCNPEPPSAQWVLDTTMDILGLRNQIDNVDCGFEEFGKMKLSQAEHELYRFGSHFYPYWSMSHGFPKTVCSDNLVTKDYLSKAIKYYKKTVNTK